MDAINNLPKPVIIGVTVVAVLAAIVAVFWSMTNNPTAGYGTREEIRARQKAGMAKDGGHTRPGQQ